MIRCFLQHEVTKLEKQLAKATEKLKKLVQDQHVVKIHKGKPLFEDVQFADNVPSADVNTTQ